MKRGRTKGSGMLFLFLLAGIIIGSLIGNLIANYTDADIFHKSLSIGTQAMPAVLDLVVVKIAFGLSFTINFGTLFGVLLGIILFYRY